MTDDIPPQSPANGSATPKRWRPSGRPSASLEIGTRDWAASHLRECALAQTRCSGCAAAEKVLLENGIPPAPLPSGKRRRL